MRPSNTARRLVRWLSNYYEGVHLKQVVSRNEPLGLRSLNLGSLPLEDIVPLEKIEYGVDGDVIYTQSHILSTQGGLYPDKDLVSHSCSCLIVGCGELYSP